MKSFYRSYQTQEIDTAEYFDIGVMECSGLTFEACPQDSYQFQESESVYENICCKKYHANYTTENNVVVKVGEELVGGAILVNGKQVALDYISFVHKSQNGGQSYEVQTRRLYCPQLENDEVTAMATQVVSPVEKEESLDIFEDNPNQSDIQDQPIHEQLVNDEMIADSVANQQSVQTYYDVNCPFQLFCFAGDMQVEALNGSKKRMDDLEIGDWIKSIYDSEVVYTNVETFLHRLPDEEIDFLLIEFDIGESLKISPKHLLYVTNCIEPLTAVSIHNYNAKLVPSEEINVGDCLLYVGENNTIFNTVVTNITITKAKGIYAPLTSTGNIVVNRILSSCYSVTENDSLQNVVADVTNYFNKFITKILEYTSIENTVLVEKKTETPFSSTWMSDQTRKIDTAEYFDIVVMECSGLTFEACPQDSYQFQESESVYGNICCKKYHANYTTENNAVVKVGEELIGGAILVNGKQVALDYISFVHKSQNGGQSYEVQTRRLYCPQLENDEVTTMATQVVSPVEKEESLDIFEDNPNQSDIQDQPIHEQLVNDEMIADSVDNQQSVQTYYDVNCPFQPFQLFCFAGDMQVEALNGSKKRMDDLEIGDWIKSIYDYEVVYTNVETFLHRLPDEEIDFLLIEFDIGESLKISPKHLLYVTNCIEPLTAVSIHHYNAKLVPSEEINVGDCLLYVGENNTIFNTVVTNITITKAKGIYAPLTSTGNIVVNRILSSCYSVTENDSLQNVVADVTNYFNKFITKILEYTSIENTVLVEKKTETPFSSTWINAISTAMGNEG
uniref:Uncharacterized protein n=1 Tax=Acrobeloides nanus TaxID=290746 RepID=A0A914CDI0_9BILA